MNVAEVAEEVLGRRIEVRGTVQGVGFRPWVYRIAREAGVGGRVWNDSRGVEIEVFGASEALDVFFERLRTEAPPAAAIREIESRGIPGEAVADFVIVPSEGGAGER